MTLSPAVEAAVADMLIELREGFARAEERSDPVVERIIALAQDLRALRAAMLDAERRDPSASTPRARTV